MEDYSARANRDIVVIGGSAGVLQALEVLLAALPADLAAALFVVVHGGSATPESLARILGAASPLRAESAGDGAMFHHGRIYVAPKNMHMLISDARIALRRGPWENMARPAIDPLFRTAASAYGSRVVGVLLSGLLYDGAAGMRAVGRNARKRRTSSGVCFYTARRRNPRQKQLLSVPEMSAERMSIQEMSAQAGLIRQSVEPCRHPRADCCAKDC